MKEGLLFYAYWNGASLRDLFEALAAITSTSTFTLVSGTLVIAGILMVMAAGAVRAEGRGVITYMACCVLFWFAAVVPRVTVVIEDVRSHAVYTVDNVPLAVGVLGSFANRTGYWLAHTYEEAFAPVDVARFSQYGAVYPERVLEVMQAVGPVTIEGRRAIDAVVRGCIMPELLTDTKKAGELAQSSDLWASVTAAGWVNPARSTAFADGTVMRCPAALQALEGTLNTTELPALKTALGAMLAPQALNPAAAVSASIPQSEALLLGLSRSMDASLRHSLMLTALPQAASRSQALSGPLALAVGLAKAQGNLASEINYRTMARIAQESLPKIRNALEFMVIGMFPIVALVALVSGQSMGGILRSYLTILLTVQLWPALASVVNHLVIAVDMYPFSMLASRFGGNSLQAAALIRETGASSQAIAGALMCAVPVIAYALVRAGDMAVGQLVGGLTGPAQAAASSQGSSLAAGNVTQGNVSLGNTTSNTVSANRFDRSVRTSDSGMAISTSPWGSVTRADGGEVTGMTRTPVNIGVSSSASQQFMRTNSSGHVAQTSSVWTQANRFSFAHAATSSDTTERRFGHALHEAIQNARTASVATTDRSGVTQGMSVNYGVDMSGANQVSESVRISSGVRGKISRENQDGLKVSDLPVRQLLSSDKHFLHNTGQKDKNGWLGLTKQSENVSFVKDEYGTIGIQADMSFNDAQQVVNIATGQQNARSKMEQIDAVEQVKSAADTVANSHRDESVRQAARAFSRSLSQNYQRAHDKSNALVDSITAATTLTEANAANVNTSVDQSVGVMQQAITTFGSPEAALRGMYQGGEGERLAGAVYDKSHSDMRPADNFGPGKMLSPIERNTAFYEDSPDAFEKAGREQDKQFKQGAVIGEDASVAREALSAPSVVDDDKVRTAVSSITQQAGDARQRMMDTLAFQRGVMMVSREAYRLEAKDKNFALRNAFFGAWGYRSGEEIQEDLIKRAEALPQLREALETVGRTRGNSIESLDWQTLTNLAREPRGFRPFN